MRPATISQQTIITAVHSIRKYGYRFSVVADAIEHWPDVDGIDGINLRQYHSFDTLRDFAELVSPILRERGRLPGSGGTLRRRLSGTDRLPAEHPAARFRGAFSQVGV